jgi:hypothetical protein
MQAVCAWREQHVKTVFGHKLGDWDVIIGYNPQEEYKEELTMSQRVYI